MTKRRFVSAGIGLGLMVLLAGIAGSGHAAPQAKRGSASEEEALIRRGIELRKARDDVSARGEFQKAYDIAHSPRAAAQLGLAEFALGRWDEAEAHVGEALRAPEDPFISKYRVELDRSLGVIKTHIAHVEIIGDPAGAEVAINGRSVGKLPLPLPVSVSEGEVDVEVRANGFVRGDRTFTLAGGQYQRVVIRLERDTGAGVAMANATGTSAGVAARGSSAGAGSTTNATLAMGDAAGAGSSMGAAGAAGTSLGGSNERHASDGSAAGAGSASGTGASDDDGNGPSVGRRAIKWAALGLTGAALATGIAATIIHNDNLSTFQSLHGGGCFDDGGRAVDVADRAVSECQPSLDAYRSARTWQIVGFAGAGVFAATWLVLTLTEPSPAATTAAATGALPSQSNQRVAAWTCLPTASHPGATCALQF